MEGGGFLAPAPCDGPRAVSFLLGKQPVGLAHRQRTQGNQQRILRAHDEGGRRGAIFAVPLVRVRLDQLHHALLDPRKQHSRVEQLRAGNHHVPAQRAQAGQQVHLRRQLPFHGPVEGLPGDPARKLIHFTPRLRGAQHVARQRRRGVVIEPRRSCVEVPPGGVGVIVVARDRVRPAVAVEVPAAGQVTQQPRHDGVRRIVHVDQPQVGRGRPGLHRRGLRVQRIALQAVAEAAVRVLIGRQAGEDLPGIAALEVQLPAGKVDGPRVAVHETPRALKYLVHMHPSCVKYTPNLLLMYRRNPTVLIIFPWKLPGQHALKAPEVPQQVGLIRIAVLLHSVQRTVAPLQHLPVDQLVADQLIQQLRPCTGQLQQLALHFAPAHPCTCRNFPHLLTSAAGNHPINCVQKRISEPVGPQPAHKLRLGKPCPGGEVVRFKQSGRKCMKQ